MTIVIDLIKCTNCGTGNAEYPIASDEKLCSSCFLSLKNKVVLELVRKNWTTDMLKAVRFRRAVAPSE